MQCGLQACQVVQGPHHSGRPPLAVTRMQVPVSRWHVEATARCKSGFVKREGVFEISRGFLEHIESQSRSSRIKTLVPSRQKK